MSKQFKPNHYNSVSPYFIVNGAQVFVALLVKIFDAKELRRYERPGGKIMHLEMQIDDSVIMIADATPEYPPNQFMMHVYVPDVDKIFARAIDNGCEPVSAPKQTAGDQDRRGTFKDFAGNMWSVGTQC